MIPLHSTTYLQRLHTLSKDSSPSKEVQDTCCFARFGVVSFQSHSIHGGNGLGTRPDQTNQ